MCYMDYFILDAYNTKIMAKKDSLLVYDFQGFGYSFHVS